ncbi:hypothetical protein EAE96_003768 [Botrytis aclada]|nr:hypothetical protein EAE96_003768 [Botrytis aclada]
MEASRDAEGRRVLRTTINNLGYLYDGEHVTCFGHKFMELCFGDENRNRSVEFWKAQLAFRGFSPRGNDIKALKEHLLNSKTDQPDTMASKGIQIMMRAYRKKNRENEEPMHQAQQARHVEEGDQDEDEGSDEESAGYNEEEDDEEEGNGEAEDDDEENDFEEDGAEGDKDSEECDDDADDSDEEANDGPWDITGH